MKQFVTQQNSATGLDTKALAADMAAVFRKHGLSAENIDQALDGLSANTAATGHVANRFELPSSEDDAPHANNAHDDGFQLPDGDDK